MNECPMGSVNAASKLTHDFNHHTVSNIHNVLEPNQNYFSMRKLNPCGLAFHARTNSEFKKNKHSKSMKLILGFLAFALFSFNPLLAQRVTNGLVSLYDFNEQSGNILHDVSGVGTAADLHLSGDYIWTGDGSVQFAGGIAQSANPVTKLKNQIAGGDDMTFELWFATDDVTQYGPKRLMTYSANTGERNFTVGQEDNKLDLRLRHGGTSTNGLPSSQANYSLDNDVHHFVASVESNGNVRFYLDGSLVDTDQISSNDFSSWSNAYKFALGNELTMDRAWYGRIYLAAIYNRDLNANEVIQNYNDGLDLPENNLTSWFYGCEEGVTVELFGAGIHNMVPYQSENFDNPNDIFEVVAEVVYKGGNPGNSVDFIDDQGNSHTAYRQNVQGNSSNIWVYRASLPQTANIAYNETASANKLQSIVCYIFRNENSGSQASGTFTQMSGYNDLTSFFIDITPENGAPDRDITVQIPISEITLDGRYLHIEVIAGDVSEGTTRVYTQGSIVDCCLDVVEVNLSGVDSSVDQIEVQIDTRHQVHASANGQSWVAAGAIRTEVECTGSNCGSIDGVYIYDQNTDSPVLGPLTNGQEIAEGELPDNYYLVLQTEGNIESVYWNVNNVEHGENHELYTFPGGAEGGNNWNAGPGLYNITASAFELDDCPLPACETIYLSIEITSG